MRESPNWKWPRRTAGALPWVTRSGEPSSTARVRTSPGGTWPRLARPSRRGFACPPPGRAPDARLPARGTGRWSRFARRSHRLPGGTLYTNGRQDVRGLRMPGSESVSLLGDLDANPVSELPKQFQREGLRDRVKVRIVLQERRPLFDGAGGNQAVGRAANRLALFPQRAVDVGRSKKH